MFTTYNRSSLAHCNPKKMTVPKQIYRLDCVKLAKYFTILVRWDEMRAWAADDRTMSWPIEPTKQGAYDEFMRVANASANADGVWYFSCECSTACFSALCSKVTQPSLLLVDNGPAVLPVAKQSGYQGMNGSYAWQQIFNHSTGWCSNALHPPAPDHFQCNYTWPNASSTVPCCDSCGDHPRYGLSNICMNYSAGEGITSTLPQYELH